MLKAKPISLSPLKFDEAIEALIRVNPNRGDNPAKRRKPKGERKPGTK
jgi:hypothetical protein